MSEAARSQFAWAHPGNPRLEGDEPLEVEDKAAIADDVRAVRLLLEAATRAVLTRACAVAAAARFLPGGHDC
jgi:hypothetical protein